MPALPESPPTTAPPLQFSCGHCGTVLSVPAALAGIQGPCPSCRRLILAPAGRPAVVGNIRTAAGSLKETPVRPQPRLPRPAAPPSPETTADPSPPPAVEERRSSLRRRAPSQSTPTPRSHPDDRPARRDRPEKEDPPPEPRARSAARVHVWTWAGVGAVIGGGLVFASVSAAQLKRDVSPAPPLSTAPRASDGNDDDALAALAAHKKASARELKSLLASQQIVWRLFAATSADEAQPLLFVDGDHPLPTDGLHTPLTSVTLRSKRRLPEEAGTASQWTVSTTRFGELVVEVTDTTGQPKVNWHKLAIQLGAQPSAPDQRTAAAP